MNQAQARHVADQSRARLLGHHSSPAQEVAQERARSVDLHERQREAAFVKAFRWRLTVVQRTLLTLLVATMSLYQVREIAFLALRVFGEATGQRLIGLWIAFCNHVPAASNPGGTTFELEVALGRLLGKRLVTFTGENRAFPCEVDGFKVRDLEDAVLRASGDPNFDRRVLDLVDRARDVWRETGQADLAFDSLRRALESAMSSDTNGDEPFTPVAHLMPCPACAVDERQRRHCLCKGTGQQPASSIPVTVHEAAPAGLDGGSVASGGTHSRPAAQPSNPSAPSMGAPMGAGPARARLLAAVASLLAEVYPQGDSWPHVGEELERLPSMSPLRELRQAYEAYERSADPPPDDQALVPRWHYQVLENAARELIGARDTLTALVAMQRLRDVVNVVERNEQMHAQMGGA